MEQATNKIKSLLSCMPYPVYIEPLLFINQLFCIKLIPLITEHCLYQRRISTVLYCYSVFGLVLNMEFRKRKRSSDADWPDPINLTGRLTPILRGVSCTRSAVGSVHFLS